MLDFIRRGTECPAPIGELPLWLSGLLRNRGIDTPEKARRVMDEVSSDRLKMILDCANLFHAGTAHPENVRPTIDRAMEFFGADVVLAHGKDIKEGPDVDHTCAGKGIVDFDYYFEELKKYPLPTTMIIHGLQSEDEFPAAVAYMKGKMEAAGLY